MVVKIDYLSRILISRVCTLLANDPAMNYDKRVFAKREFSNIFMWTLFCKLCCYASILESFLSISNLIKHLTSITHIHFDNVVPNFDFAVRSIML